MFPGGEVAFVRAIIKESSILRHRVGVYTSMLGKKSSLDALHHDLSEQRVPVVRSTVLSQGKQARWGLAWSWHAPHDVARARTSATGKRKLEQRSNERSFVVEGVTCYELQQRVEGVLRQPQVPGCLLKVDWESTKADYSAASSSAKSTDGMFPGDLRLPCVARLDSQDKSSFRFTVSTSTHVSDTGMQAVEIGPVSSTVTMTFEAGTDTSRKMFWVLFETMQRDVQRTSRKWRRKANIRKEKEKDEHES